jgi:hypothetical protein
VKFILALRHAALGALFMVAACGKDTATSQLPLRSDCIVGARLIWPEYITETDAQATVARMTNELTRHRQPGLAGIRNQGHREIYVIYSDDCQARHTRFGYLVRQLQLKIYQAPRLEVIDGVIEPGPETIQVYGPQWRDGENPGDQ